MGKTAFIFPGQGAQVCGMGQDFYENSETAKAVFDRATELLGFSVPELCFEKNDRLDITEYTQAAMVTTSVAMMKVMEERGIHADVAAGLSLGEYCALVAAGVMTADDAIRTVRERGILMQEAVPAGVGGMSAVLGMTADEINAVVDEIPNVQVANYNCPGQLVISGAVEAVDAACEKAKAAGARRALRLPVGGAFHSPLMEPAKQELEKAIAEAPFQTPVCPVYQNVDAKPYTDPAAIKANLIAQLTAPVHWTYIVRNMLSDGVTEFTELGPGSVLQGLIRKVDPNAVVESKSTL